MSNLHWPGGHEGDEDFDRAESDFTCDGCGCGARITEEQYDRGDGFCPDCAAFHGVEETEDDDNDNSRRHRA